MFKDKISKEVLFDIIEHFYAAVYIVDSEGRLIYRNEAGQKLDEDDENEDIGNHLENVYNKTVFKGDMISPTIKALRFGKSYANENLEWYAKNNKKVNAITSTYPFKDENGRVLFAYAISEDIMQLRKHLIEQGSFYRKKMFQMKNKVLRNGTHYTFDDIIGESESLRKAILIAQRFAEKKMPVMIYGETGTGKEMFAQSIHNASNNSEGPFVPINCSAIPETLLESTLFGTVKGGFTGAVDSPGLFEKAEGGTLFLDEINSMPVLLQAKILRALQEKEVQRVGDSKFRKINCRIISAVNKLPVESIRDKELREDLFYRLSTGIVWVPALRERENDIEILIHYFLEKANDEFETDIISISPNLIELLKNYQWPGNVRELANTIESAVNLTTDGEYSLEVRHLPDYLKQHFKVEMNLVSTAEEVFSVSSVRSPGENIAGSINDMVDAYEKEILLFALNKTNGNMTECGKTLGISRQALAVKLKKYGINPKQFKNK